MDKRKKIFLITGIIITVVIGAVFCGIIVILNLKKNDYHTFYLEAREENNVYCHTISLSNNIIDMLTFSFTTKPNGLITVSLELWGMFVPLFSAINITNYEVVLLESDSSLRFCNWNWFGIEVSVKYEIKQLLS